MDALSGLAKRSLHAFQRREEINAEGNVVLRGIERVGFKARIENSNIFMTGLIFFAAFVIFVIILVILFYFWVKLAVRKGWIRHDRFLELQRGWTNVLRGILFRIVSLAHARSGGNMLLMKINFIDPARLSTDGCPLSVGADSP